MKNILMIGILLNFMVTFLYAKGEVTKVYAHYENAEKSSYKINKNKYYWGRGKNLVIDGFEYNGIKYKYKSLANRIKIVRVDNKNSSGYPCGLFVEKINNYKYKPSYPDGCDMAKVMGGRIINIGALDLFKNGRGLYDGSKNTAKNIERVDFITDNGIKAPSKVGDLEKAGHVVTEKSGNNPINIAAILKLDNNGNPVKFGPLVKVHGSDVDYGIVNIYLPDGSPIGKQNFAFLVNGEKAKKGKKPKYKLKSKEPLGMAFVSLEDLGVKAGETYYGFSYFGEDVDDSYDLTKPETFPVDNFSDAADPYGGVAGYFVDESISIEDGTPFSCKSQSFISFNTSRNGPKDGSSQFDVITLSDGTLKSHNILTGANGVNSIGYNIKDNYIWGYNLATDKLVRIDAENRTVLFDLPEDLEADFYIAADVDKDGILYLATRGADEIKRVNVDSSSSDFLKVLPPLKLKKLNMMFMSIPATISTADMAFNPKDGFLYFIEEDSGGKVYKIDPTTGIKSFVTDSGVDPYVVACFFDVNGNFYFNLGTGDSTRELYKIDLNKGNPKAEPFGYLDKSLTNGDGARCPNAEVEQPEPKEANAMILTRDGNSDNKKTRIYKFYIDINTDKISDFQYVKTVDGVYRSLTYYKGKFITARADNSDKTRGKLYSISMDGELISEPTLGDIDGSLNKGYIQSLVFDEDGNRLFTQSWKADGHISKNSAGNYIFTNTNPNINYALAYLGGGKLVASFESNGVKSVNLSNGFITDITGDDGISCTYGGESVSSDKSYFIVAKGALDEKKFYVVEDGKWKDIGFNYGEFTQNSKAEALAIVHDDPTNSSESLSPEDCTNAPDNIVIFKRDFDFNKNSDVDGDGSKGTIARYKNIAIVNGENVDVIVSVEDLKGISTLEKTNTTPKGFKFQKIEGEDPSIGFFIGSKNEDEIGTEYEATLKFQFVKSDTDTPVDFNFETQVYDIDNFENRTEKIKINKNDYQFFQVSEDSHIKGERIGELDIFQNKENEDSTDFAKNAMVKFVHKNKSSFIMKFSSTKNKESGRGIGKAGFNIVFGKADLGLPSCGVSLIADYHFDECSWDGTTDEVKDSSGNDFHGTAMTREAGKSLPTTFGNEKIVNRSAKFTMSEKHFVKVTNMNNFDHNSFSTSIWIKVHDNVNGWQTLLHKGASNGATNGVFRLKYKYNYGHDKLGLYTTLDDNTDVHFYKEDIGLKDKKWHHIVITYEDREYKVYVDKKLVINEKIKKDIITPNNKLHIGGKWYISNMYIDEVKIYQGALSANKIDEIYDNEQTGKNCDGTDREQSSCLLPIECTDNAIVIDYLKNQDSPFEILHNIDLVTGKAVSYRLDSDHVNGSLINGFGYNIKDGYLWGSDIVNKGYLVRVGKDSNGNFTQEKIGPIEELNEKSTYIGDVDNDGYLYLYYKNQPSARKSKIYKIDLDQSRSNYNVEIYTFNRSIDIADMAINPVDHKIYALSSNNNFYRIDIEKRKIDQLANNIIDYGDGLYGTSFFDSAGYFYAIKNDNRKTVRVTIDKNSATAIEFSTISVGDEEYKNDGGRCKTPIKIDFADAPDSYSSLLSDDGPRHKIPWFGKAKIYFGNGVSYEADAKQIDQDDFDDAFESEFEPLFVNQEKYSLKLKVHNETGSLAYIVGWIDFNGNGEFEQDEGSSATLLGSNNVELEWNIPDNIKAGDTYARFRVSTEELTLLDFKGAVSDGEVEDYKITIRDSNILDAWGFPEGSIDNPVIRTKIVNQPFTLKTVSLNSARTEETPYIYSDVKIGLFDKNGTVVVDYQDINTTTPHDLINFNITKPHKYIYAKFRYKDDNNITHEVNATDPFAVRPRYFNISADRGSEIYFRAGKDFNMTIHIEDYNGDNITSGYNESKNVYQIDYNETKEPTCIRGQFDFNQTDFVNGVATFKANYSEVGELNFKVKEIDGKEFAIVDKDDGSGSSRFIEEGSDWELFHPAKLNALFKYRSINNKPYTYYSSDPREMGVQIDVNLTVLNDKNQTLQNYTDGCYNDDVNIRIDYQRWGNIDMPLFVNSSDGSDANVTNNGNSHAGAIHYAIDKSRFLNGKSSRSINMNFDRTVNIPKAPLKFKFTTTKTEIWPSTVSVDGTIDKAISFIYARAHAPVDQSVVGDTINAVVDYEVYLPLGINGSDYGLPNGLVDSADDIYWYKLPIDSVFGYKIGTAPELRFAKGAAINASTPVSIDIKAEKTPYTNRVVYTPKDFLLYNRFNSSTTRHSFRINLNSEKSNWNGKGKQGSTVDEQVSNRGLKKMDW